MKSSGKAIIKRIERRLKAVGLTENAASLAAGLSRDAIRSIRRNIESGRQRGVSSETLDKLAPVLRTSKTWLLAGEGTEDTASELSSEDISAMLDAQAPPHRMVRVKGYVGASGEAFYYRVSDEDFEEVEAPDDASDQTVAVEIRGKSFGPLVDSWLVFYDDVRSPITEDLIGKTCVVGLADDRIVLKEIRRDGRGGYQLLSNSGEPPIENAQIEWAAKVTSMRQR